VFYSLYVTTTTKYEHMKTVSQATLRGFVTKALPSMGAIEISGLLVYLDKGVVVAANDFVQLDMVMDEHGLWRGRIEIHVYNPLSSLTPAAQPAQTATQTDGQLETHTAVVSPDLPSSPAAQAQPAPQSSGRSFTRASGSPQTSPALPSRSPGAQAVASSATRASRFSSRPPAAPSIRNAPSAAPQATTRPVFNTSFPDDEDIPF
jgi:hypothetical protein